MDLEAYLDTYMTEHGTSTDITSWVETTATVDVCFVMICYGGGTFVGLTMLEQPTVYSNNGMSWTKASVVNTWDCVCYDNSMFVAIKDGSTSAGHSADGASWH